VIGATWSFLRATAKRPKRFYGAGFGWRFEDIPGADCTMITTSEDGIQSGFGGLAQATGVIPSVPNGKVVIPKTDVLGYGWFAHFRDPDGNVVGRWEDAPEER
jgi:predicted enzyme related to lactoylglutathione lyase